jgi:hypothetical protein
MDYSEALDREEWKCEACVAVDECAGIAITVQNVSNGTKEPTKARLEFTYRAQQDPPGEPFATIQAHR